MINPSNLEIHQGKSKVILGIYFISCDECGFEASHGNGRYEIIAIGDPFVRHVWHSYQEDNDIRELINELELDLEGMEVEF